MLIKVLGPGCAKCKEVEKVINVVVQESGVMSTPAVIIDGTIMCTGRIPSKSEVMEWIH